MLKGSLHALAKDSKGPFVCRARLSVLANHAKGYLASLDMMQRQNKTLLDDELGKQPAAL